MFRVRWYRFGPPFIGNVVVRQDDVLSQAEGAGPRSAMEDEEEPDYSPDEGAERRKRDRSDEESSGAEEMLEEARRARRQRVLVRDEPKTEQEKKFNIPERIKEALKKARSFNEFRKLRVFRFLHLFSGKRDVLGKEILRQGAAEGL